MKRIAQYGLLIALAFIFSYIEVLLPVLSFVTPGIKLGLSNIAIVITLYALGAQAAVWVSLVRVLLVAMTFGNMATLMYSIGGAILSLIVMCLLKQVRIFSIFGVSMAGGVFHNVGQLAVAIVLLKTSSLIWYMPILISAGAVTGLGIGWLSAQIMIRIPAHMMRPVKREGDSI